MMCSKLAYKFLLVRTSSVFHIRIAFNIIIIFGHNLFFFLEMLIMQLIVFDLMQLIVFDLLGYSLNQEFPACYAWLLLFVQWNMSRVSIAMTSNKTVMNYLCFITFNLIYLYQFVAESFDSTLIAGDVFFGSLNIVFIG